MSMGLRVAAQETRPAFHARKGFCAKLDASPGLYVVTYQTPEGKILVYLPNDLHAAESVVGTMRLQPKGRDDGERAASLTALAACHVLWGKQVQAVQETPLTWTLPAGEPMEAGLLTLADAQDHPLAQTDLPVAAPLLASLTASGGAGDAQPPSNVTDSRINLPRRGVVGQPLVLQAPVGTQALIYQVLVGDKPARLLAASPRSLIVESPNGVLGKTTLQVKREDQRVAEAVFQNDRATRRTNPWPYVIGATIVVGVAAALIINSEANSIAHGIGSGFGNLHF